MTLFSAYIHHPIHFRKFDKEKCWILHLGQSNSGCPDRLGKETLESHAMERKLGALVEGLMLLPASLRSLLQFDCVWNKSI